MNLVNNSGFDVHVSVNRWGTGGSTDPYTIKAGESADWDRSDSRGFVMYLENSGGFDGPYYILADAQVVFNKDLSVTEAVKV